MLNVTKAFSFIFSNIEKLHKTNSFSFKICLIWNLRKNFMEQN